MYMSVLSTCVPTYQMASDAILVVSHHVYVETELSTPGRAAKLLTVKYLLTPKVCVCLCVCFLSHPFLPVAFICILLVQMSFPAVRLLGQMVRKLLSTPPISPLTPPLTSTLNPSSVQLLDGRTAWIRKSGTEA